MTVIIKPSQIIGTVIAPASKSMAHRLLICAGLSEGTSHIKNVAYSEDILATLDCLEAMGATVQRGNDYVIIDGCSPIKSRGAEYKCRESGSTLRFFIPIAMLSENESIFKCCGRLIQRSMTVYESLAKEKGLYYKAESDGIKLRGKLLSGAYTVAGDISSQFISGLLFALPLCEGESEISLAGDIESRSYIDMTLDAMKMFGVSANWKNENTIYIKGGQSYRASNLTVEGDYSNAAFLDAFNCLGGNVNVNGLKSDTLQGDSVYKRYFNLLKKGNAVLDIRNCPDLAPILMTLASELNGAVLKGTKRLRLKESDRGEVMKQELSKFGADIEVYDNEIIINKCELRTPEIPLDSHNDHRVVMSLAVLCSKYGGEIKGAEAVRKSYPDFSTVAEALGLEIKEYDGK